MSMMAVIFMSGFSRASSGGEQVLVMVHVLAIVPVN